MLEDVFAKKKRGGDSNLGAFMQGGGDIALTDESVRSTLLPFFADFILNEKLMGCFGSSSDIISSSLELSSSCCKKSPAIPFQPSTSGNITVVHWLGAGRCEEIRELMLQLNGIGLTNYVSVFMTDIDQAPVVAFSSRTIKMPNVTYTKCWSACASHSAPHRDRGS